MEQERRLTDYKEPKVEITFQNDQVIVKMQEITPQHLMDASVALEKSAIRLLKREPAEVSK